MTSNTRSLRFFPVVLILANTLGAVAAADAPNSPVAPAKKTAPAMPGKAAVLSAPAKPPAPVKPPESAKATTATTPQPASVCARRAPKDPMAPNLAEDPTAASPLARIYDLRRDERVDIACQVKEAILRQYSLVALKRELVGIDAGAHLENCARAELRIKNDERTAFIDRMMACLAVFQDTHLQASPSARHPGVTTAISAGWVGSKLVIVNRIPRLLSLIKEVDGVDLAPALPLGAEIVTVDGVPAEAAVTELEKYIGASSPAAARTRAASAVLERRFLYPKNKTVHLQIKSAPDAPLTDVNLPWWSGGQAEAPYANALLDHAGIRGLENLIRDYDESKNSWKIRGLEVEGKDDQPLFTGETDHLVDFFNENQRLKARAGFVIFEGKGACYLQLLSFSPEKLATKDGKGGDFLEVISKLIAACEKKKTPLILDLRENDGGNGLYPIELLRLIAPKDKLLAADVRGMRITANAAQTLNQMTANPNSTGARLGNSQRLQLLLDSFAQSVRSRKPYTDLVAAQDLMGAGFGQKVITLITPECISACDMFVALQKINRVGVILGTHTNGTGAGMFTNGPRNTEFHDTYDVLKFQIPNTLFGVHGNLGRSSYPFEEGRALILENRPTAADVPYATSLEDIVDNLEGWRKVVAGQL